MPYCASCGRNVRRTKRGLCARCAEDFRTAGKRTDIMRRFPDTLTAQWIAENAKRYRTKIAKAFIRACDGD